MSTRQKVMMYVASLIVLGFFISGALFAEGINVNDSSLAAYWSFDKKNVEEIEGGYRIKDSSTYGNDGTSKGCEIVEGMKNEGLKFNGTSDHIVFPKPNPSSLELVDKFSVMLWVKPEKQAGLIIGMGGWWTGWRMMASGGGPANGVIYFGFGGREGKDYAGKSFRAYIPTGVFERWRHVAVTFDKSLDEPNARMYIDGKLKTTLHWPKDLTKAPNSNIRVGDAVGGAEFFQGMMDELLIYNRCLSADEVKRIYTGGNNSDAFVIPRREKEIVIDGKLNEWMKVSSIKIDRPAQVKVGTWSGQKELSGEIKVIMDNENLYLAADIRQDVFIGNECPGPASWQNDCIELFIETCHIPKDESAVGWQKLAETLEGGSGYDYQLLLNPGSGTGKPRIWFSKRRAGSGRMEVEGIRGTNDEEAKGGEIAVLPRRGGKGYMLEAMIPLSNFKNFVPEQGIRIGFDIALDHCVDFSKGRKTQMVWHGTAHNFSNTFDWGRAYIFNLPTEEKEEAVSETQLARAEVEVKISGNIRYEINGMDKINRKLFGIDTVTYSINSHQGKYLSEMSDGFARIIIKPNTIKLPGLSGMSEAEKRVKILDPEYWKGIDMGKACVGWSIFENIAKHNPKAILICILQSSLQFERDPFDRQGFLNFFRKDHIEFVKKYPGGLRHQLRSIENSFGYEITPRDKELYARFLTEVLAKLKTLFSAETTFYITLGNETNCFMYFLNQRIADDVMKSFLERGDYRAGKIAMEEYLKVYNPLMTSIKERLPEMKVGGPSTHPSFDEKAGRVQWKDYMKPFLDKAEVVDFFDFHYGNNSSTNQVLGEVIKQYTLKTRGKAVPLLDAESGWYTFKYKRPGDITAFRGVLNNERVWYGYFNHPEKIIGWCEHRIPLLVDGFGRSKAANTGHYIFRNLRGVRVWSQSSAASVKAVSAVNGNMLNTVVFNDSPLAVKVKLDMYLPERAKIKGIEAEMLYYNPAKDRLQIARFAPVRGNSSSAQIYLSLPPFSTGSVLVHLDKEAVPMDSVIEKAFSGNNWVFNVERGKPAPEIAVSIPGKELRRKGIEAFLQVGHAWNQKKQALVFINGKGPLYLPVYLKGSNWHRDDFTRLSIDTAWLKETNRISFKSEKSAKPYRVLFASILLRDKISTESAGSGPAVTFSLEGPPKPIVTGAPSTTSPEVLLSEEPAPPKKTPALRGYWTFDEVKETVVSDHSSYKNNGEVVGNLKVVTGRYGKALSFDGKTYVNIPNAESLQFDQDEDYSITAWIRTASSSNQAILTKMATKAIIFSVSGGEGTYREGQTKFYISSPTGNTYCFATSDVKVNDGKWHHVAAVRDFRNRLLLVYVDGRYAGSGPDATHGNFHNSKPVHIGVNYWPVPWNKAGWASFFKGMIDEVRIYGCALTPKQIKIIMENRVLKHLGQVTEK